MVAYNTTSHGDALIKKSNVGLHCKKLLRIYQQIHFIRTIIHWKISINSFTNSHKNCLQCIDLAIDLIINWNIT